jgi:hypothetical protein
MKGLYYGLTYSFTMNPQIIESAKFASQNLRNLGEHGIERKFGWKYLGAGCERTCFAISKWHAIKIARDGYQNKKELKFYNKNPQLHKWLLKPIVWDEQEYLWIIYPRASQPTSKETRTYNETYLRLQAQAEKEFLEAAKLSRAQADLHRGNWGYYLGKIVVIDAGLIGY